MTQNKPTVTIINGKPKLRKIADRPVLEKYIFSTTEIKSPNLTAAEQKQTEDEIEVQEKILDNFLVDDREKGFSIEIESAKFPDKIGRKSRKNSK